MLTEKNSADNGALQINGKVNAPVNVNINKSASSQEKTALDVHEAAEEWFTKVEGVCPPIRMGDPEGIAERYYKLRDNFVTRVDKEYDELPDKRVLYEILNNLKAQMK